MEAGIQKWSKERTTWGGPRRAEKQWIPMVLEPFGISEGSVFGTILGSPHFGTFQEIGGARNRDMNFRKSRKASFPDFWEHISILLYGFPYFCNEKYGHMWILKSMKFHNFPTIVEKINVWTTAAAATTRDAVCARPRSVRRSAALHAVPRPVLYSPLA